MTPPPVCPEQHQRNMSAARAAPRRAAFTLARDRGAELTPRPVTTIRDVEPLAGLKAARDIELAARRTARDYIRDARETGHTWHDIGTALTITRNAAHAGQPAAEAAHSYAAGDPDTDTGRRYGRSFDWTCQSCDHIISDRGPDNEPADNERDHAQGCARLAETIAAWDAGWGQEAEP